MAPPDALRLAALRLEHQAAGLPWALDVLVWAVSPAVWEGPGARRFEDDLRLQRQRLHAAADELRAVARDLTSQAAVLEAHAGPGPGLPAWPAGAGGRPPLLA